MGIRLRRTRDLAREDEKHLGRVSDATPIEIVSARGIRLRDARGRSYIDLTSGSCVVNFGWNHPTILERLHAVDVPSYVAPSLLYAPWVELARRLTELVPGNLEVAYRATTGTEAVELALQIAMTYTKRAKFVSLADAYHGNSLLAHSIGDADQPAHVPGCKELALPLDEAALDRLRTLLAPNDVAAFIMEPISMNHGVVVPSPDFMRGAARLCEQHGTLFVMDEVASGWGRTGKLFATEYFDVAPDLMCLAKSITNGHAPLGATLARSEIADAVKDDLEFYATFGWHPFAVEAALATLDLVEREGDAILANVAERSVELATALGQLPWRRQADVHVKGLALAVHFEDAKGYPGELADACREAGLLVLDEDDALVMFPPLVIDRETTREAIEILERVVTR